MMANNNLSTDQLGPETLNGGGGSDTNATSGPSMLSNGLKQGRSKVWNEFSITECGTRVTCRRCGDSLSYSHSHSTSSMLKHLKRKHLMNLYPPEEAGDNTGGNNSDVNRTPTKSPEKQPKQPKKPKAKKVPPTPAPEMPEYQEEQILEHSIQHAPLLFSDPCVRMRWADHSDTFLKTFSVMYNDESYTDCILVAEKQFFKGHRMVLSSASEHLDEIFKMAPTTHHPIIFLNNVKAMELRVLLDFIYKGEVAIPPNLIPGLVKVGSELKVKGLSDFVWNDQLASTIFPQGYSNQAPPSQSQQTYQSTCVPDTSNNHNNMNTTSYAKHATVSDTNLKSHHHHLLNTSTNSSMNNLTPRGLQSNASSSSSGGGVSPQRTSSIIAPIHKTYARLVPTGRVAGGGVLSSHGQNNLNNMADGSNSHSSILDHCSPQQFKRLKLMDGCTTNVSSVGNTLSPSNSQKGNTGNLPDTVLMVTNQGETILSTSTLMTPNSISLPVSFAIKDDSSMGSQSHHGQFVSSQPVTILSSCGSGNTHGLDEVVYSITEVPGGGHEVLMSHGMDPIGMDPIVVYDTSNVSEDDPGEKKLFQDEMHKN